MWQPVENDLTIVQVAKAPGAIQVRRFAGPESYIGLLDGLRIAHLTDLHVGIITPFRVQCEAARLTNQANPDLVVITGDFVCHTQRHLDQLEEVIGLFEAPVVAVLGNHDYWSGAREVRRVLRRAGAEVLDNAWTTITLGHQVLQVLGLDDAYTGHADRDKALRGLRRDLPTLGLSHIAEEADALWAGGVPLVLSGHTHGGQVTFARLHELSIGKIAGHRYVHGLYGSRSQQPVPGAVYVGAGIGASVMPLRLGDRGKREVTLFELGEQPGAFSEHHDSQPPLPGRSPSKKTKQRRAMAVEKLEKKRNQASNKTSD